MNFIRQIERIKKMHKLICSEKTGTPTVLARKLCISRSQLYIELDLIKEFEAPIKYCKKRQSYYYETYFELMLNYSLKTMKDDETIEIYGGSCFPSKLLDGTLVSLL